MPIKMPLNKAGKRADKANEAHVFGVHAQAHGVLVAEHNAQDDQAGRDAIMAKWSVISDAQEQAYAKAIIGDAYWRGAIEHGGKTILDYWVDGAVVYHPIIDHANASSKLSFLYYLGHSLSMAGHQLMSEAYADLLNQQIEMERQAQSSTHWKFSSIGELVE